MTMIEKDKQLSAVPCVPIALRDAVSVQKLPKDIGPCYWKITAPSLDPTSWLWQSRVEYHYKLKQNEGERKVGRMKE